MNNGNEDGEIGLLDLFLILKKRWLWVLCSGPVFGIIAYFILTFVSNTYASQVFLTASSSSEQMNSSAGSGLSAMGALAGINLGGTQDNKVYVAIEIIKSRKFAIDFIDKHNLKVDLFALKGWDGSNNIIDDTIYDMGQKEWVREVRPPMTPEPQDWEIYEAFSELVSVREDDNGFIIVTLEGRSPTMVQEWLEWIIADINSIMKVRDQNELERSLEFLQNKISTVELQEIRQVFSRLIEEQTRKLMMTESRENYVLEVLDPAFEPANPVKPKRLLIVFFTIVLSSILVGIIAILVDIEQNRFPVSSAVKD